MDFLKDFFPLITTAVMVLFGIAVKRFPILASLPNNLIWLCNLIIGVFSKLVAPVDVEAAGFFGPFTASIGWLWPILQVLLARSFYETVIKPTEELAGAQSDLVVSGRSVVTRRK